jgi:peptidoglycan/xylan/chitin deacetylase (PgdA/CDA1 family)
MDTGFLARSKGLRHLIRRTWSIARFYGLEPSRMERALQRFIAILETHGGRATLPIPAVTLVRQPDLVRRLQAGGIELAVHGWTHIPLDDRPREEQEAHLRRARNAFEVAGIQATGFRAPYLRRDDNLRAAAKAVGFDYVSNQPILWDALEGETFSPATRATYQRAVAFYAPWRANQRPSLPQLRNGLVEIPVSLPDDEILGDRLGGGNDLVERVWRRILVDTHRRGELFTIQLHPERIDGCAQGLSVVLSEARRLAPPVWLARLDEIAAWWRARADASVMAAEAGGDQLHVTVTGPDGTAVLARGVKVDAPTEAWTDTYRQVRAKSFAMRAPIRPFIGVSPASPPELGRFLRRQGYVVETTPEANRHAYFFDRPEFAAGHGRALLDLIESTHRPLVRLGLWPRGARSALAITGDIDALTLWDYGLRLLGR